MKNRRNIMILFISIYLLSIFLIHIIYKDIGNIQGNIGYNKMVIKYKEIGNRKFLRGRDIDNIKEVMGDERVAYYSSKNILVNSSLKNKEMKVYGVGGSLDEFYRFNTEGSFIKDDFNLYREKVVVLHKSAANELFGTANVLGLNIEINGEDFKIIGIVSTQDYIIHRFTQDHEMMAFIPISTFEDIIWEKTLSSPELLISDLEISLGNKNGYWLKDVLRNLGIQEEDFVFQDFQEKDRIIYQRKKLLVFFIGLIFIYGLLKGLFSSIDRLAMKIRKFLRTDYWVQIIINRWKEYIFDLIKIMGIIGIVLFIWKFISFEPYLIPSKVPDDPTSLSQIMDIVGDGVKLSFMADNIYGIYIQRQVNSLMNLSKICFYIGCLSLLYVLGNYGRQGYRAKVANKTKESI